MDDVELTARKIEVYLPVSVEMLQDPAPTWQEVEAAQAAWNALPAEERDRINAERAAAYEAARCPCCGNHPDDVY